MTLRPAEPLVLKSEDSDFLSIIIQDDLSLLTFMRIGAEGKIEQREPTTPTLVLDRHRQH